MKYVKKQNPKDITSLISDHKRKNKLNKVCISAMLLHQTGCSFPITVWLMCYHAAS